MDTIEDVAQQIIRECGAARIKITDAREQDQWRGDALLALDRITNMAGRIASRGDANRKIVEDVIQETSQILWPDGRYHATFDQLGLASFLVVNGRVREPSPAISQFNGRRMVWFADWVRRHEGAIVPVSIPPACRNEA